MEGAELGDFITVESRADGTPPAQRRAFVERALAAGAALLGGGLVAGGLPRLAVSSPSAKETRILEFALLVEDVKAAFYRQAAAAGVLSGEIATFAQVAGAHERAHAKRLRQVLGSGAPAPPSVDFGDATSSAEAFGRAAIQLEELSLADYNGQAPNLRGAALDAALEIVSVEARHAAWIRDIVGKPPAPVPADQPLSAAQARARLTATGFVSQ
jgi:hypothetical protein